MQKMLIVLMLCFVSTLPLGCSTLEKQGIDLTQKENVKFLTFTATKALVNFSNKTEQELSVIKNALLDGKDLVSNDKTVVFNKVKEIVLEAVPKEHHKFTKLVLNVLEQNVNLPELSDEDQKKKELFVNALDGIIEAL